MQLRKEKKGLSLKHSVRSTLATTEDLAKQSYQISVRLHLCLASIWADDNIERNITSSDIEFLEGEDEEKKSISKTTRKKKDKPENSRTSIDKAKHALTASDLSSGLQADGDVDMNDIMLVYDQIIDKGLTLSHTARWTPIPQQSSERMLATLSQGTLNHNNYPVLMLSSSVKRARLNNDPVSSFGNNPTSSTDENR